MHDDIRKFSLEGDMGDSNVVETRERLIQHVEGLMRDYNYVPALDIEPQFTLDYSPDSNGFKFTLSVYGVQDWQGESMDNRRNFEWQRDSEVYTPEQVEGVLAYCEVEIESENENGFLAYCPFHNNVESAAFGINKYNGRWACFNPSCDTNGSLEELLMETKGLNPYEAARVIIKQGRAAHGTTTNRIDAIRAKQATFVEFPAEPLERMRQAFWWKDEAVEYMTGRGFVPDTLAHFDVGYSEKQGMVIVPMHDPYGMPLGFIGRSLEGKVFKNSTNLPKSKTAWNFHRAKREGDTVIVVESSFDAMRIHQAGYPHVIALLGGHATSYHLEQIDKAFSRVIIMTDFDKKQYRPNCRRCVYECTGHRPGRELGWSISNGLFKQILWAAYDDEVVYPHGAKDAGDMTDDEIRQCLHNAVSNFAYSRWNIDDRDDDVFIVDK